MAHGLTPPSWLRQPLAVGVHSSLSPSPSFFFLFYSGRVGCAPVVHGCERMPSASLHTWSCTQEWVALAASLKSHGWKYYFLFAVREKRCLFAETVWLIRQLLYPRCGKAGNTDLLFFFISLMWAATFSFAWALRLSPTTTSKIQDTFVIWIALQAKCSIHIRHLLQQPDSKENPFCKCVFRREDVYI